MSLPGIVRVILLAGILASIVSQAGAQPAGRRNPATNSAPNPDSPRTTVVEIKLLAGTDGGGLHSQQWSKLMEPLDVAIQIQRSTLNDKPEVRERTVGTIRYVTAVGMLERSGRVVFPQQSFELSDGPKLREWINDLKTYGAQGTPNGQPMWGLTREQFHRLYDSLLKPADTDSTEMALADAIAKLPLPPQYPVRFGQDAKAVLAHPGARTKVRQNVTGFTAATALAIILNDCHLGFCPNRTPAGGVELLVEPIGQRKDLWAVGWPLQKQRIKAAPKLFAMTPVELNEVALVDLLPTVSELTGTPVMIDYYEIEQKKIDLSALMVSFKRAETSWSAALKTMVIPKKLSREIWQDENGRAFVWITTNRPGRPREE